MQHSQLHDKIYTLHAADCCCLILMVFVYKWGWHCCHSRLKFQNCWWGTVGGNPVSRWHIWKLIHTDSVQKRRQLLPCCTSLHMVDFICNTLNPTVSYHMLLGSVHGTHCCLPGTCMPSDETRILHNNAAPVELGHQLLQCLIMLALTMLKLSV